MSDVAAYVFGNFRGGVQDRDATRLPFSYCRNITNMRVDRGSLRSRNGYAKRYSAAIQGGAPIQGGVFYPDLSEVGHIIVACNGKLFRDDLDVAL